MCVRIISICDVCQSVELNVSKLMAICEFKMNGLLMAVSPDPVPDCFPPVPYV